MPTCAAVGKDKDSKDIGNGKDLLTRGSQEGDLAANSVSKTANPAPAPFAGATG